MIRDKETYALVIAGAVLLGVAAAILGTINGVGVSFASVWVCCCS